jgi:ferrous iron transport protein A
MINKQVSLSDMPVGSDVIVSKVETKGTIKRRLLDLGFVPGARVKVALQSPVGDPIAYEIRGTVIALRKSDAHGILVSKKD